MFEKILIANRGEIACRIIRSCKKMGIKTVAVYSEADEGALPARMADEAYIVGAAPPQESYLNISKIIDVARASGAQAIHPGYGFLAENPAFAKACVEANLAFIGPSPDAIELVGDKLNALEAARKAGVPALPRSGEIQEGASDEEVFKTASRVGYPLLLKPAAGGGGLGITIVHSSEQLLDAVQSSRSLSQRVFGKARLYFEKYLPCASHIEVQLLGDARGNTLHFFERDCSVQRWNRKILEEAPSNKLAQEEKEIIYQYALRLARQVNYTNAGTVEFLVGPSPGKGRKREVYFLEMNTRIQVEHGVTEMITGKDLVELQIRMAAGEALRFRQQDLKIQGHAIEARVYPEVAGRDGQFIPQGGAVRLYKPPREIPGIVRLESALYEGYEVLGHYEPLMAKVICWGKNKRTACKKMHQTLDHFGVVGVHTNLQALKVIVLYNAFIADVYTTLILENPDLWKKLDKAASAQACKISEEEMEKEILNERIWDYIGLLN